MLSEIRDVTDPKWPSSELLKKYDHLNRSDFGEVEVLRLKQSSLAFGFCE